jgi:DNA-binding NarL/FixJ family response regulator
MATQHGVARDIPVLALSVEILNASGTRRRRIVSALVRDGIDVAKQPAGTRSVAKESRTRTGDALVVDLHHAESSAGDLHLIVEQACGTPVVVISGASDRRAVRLALAAGADGFVVDDELERCLAPAVRGVCSGQLSVPRDARNIVARPKLSTREKQVLGMVVLGFSNGEIAAKLFIAESTVKSHLSSAFSKLGVRSRNEATAMILDLDSGLGTGILAISGEHERLGPVDGPSASWMVERKS